MKLSLPLSSTYWATVQSFIFALRSPQLAIKVIFAASLEKMLDFVDDAEASGSDEPIDMLLTKKYYDFDLDYAKEKHGERLYDDEDSYLNNLLNTLTKRNRERIISEIKLSYLAEWSAAKRSRTNKTGAN